MSDIHVNLVKCCPSGAVLRVSKRCRPNPDFLWSLDGAIELHAAFPGESRTRLPSVSAARRKSGGATSPFVVLARRDHSSRPFVRQQ